MKWELVWSDEFTTNGAPDLSKWAYDIGGHGWGNQEEQFYTNRIENCFIRDGLLHIVAHKEKFENKEYTSAKIATYPNFDLTYGRVEVKAQLPKGMGTWPAIWMLATSIKHGTKWPLCGEIDIMEHVGREQDVVHFSLHTEKRNFKLQNHLTYFTEISGASDRMMEYAMNWTQTDIEFFVDGVSQVKFYKSDFQEGDWPFTQPYFLILNLAVGGTWGGPVDESLFPVTFKFDYVRMYKGVEK